MNTKSDWSNEYEAGEDLPEFEGELLLWQVVVMPVLPPKKTAGGIIVPDEAQDYSEYQNRVGRIVQIGPYCYRHPKYESVGLYPEDQLQKLKRGDWILFGQYKAFRIEQRGVKFIIMNDDEIIAKIHKPDVFKAYVYGG